MKKDHNKGFTLVELLVAISILGIITLLALPQISNIQNNNKTTKYKKYAETMITSGKLYVDAYSEDMFGNNTGGCIDIPYNDMRAKNLLKAIKVDGATCDYEDTFIRVRKSGDHYTYESSIYCKDKNGNVVYDQRLSKDGCTIGPDINPPTIGFNKEGTDWTNNPAQTIKISIYDENGMLENAKVKYIWVLNGIEVGEYKTYSFKNKRYEGIESSPLLSEEISVPYSSSGEYYLKVVPIDVRDAYGNYQTATKNSGLFKIDTTKPTCSNIKDNSMWINSTVNIEITCNDIHSKCKKNTYTKEYNTSTVKTDSLTIKDNAGNTATCTYNVYLDKEAPNPPTTGAIGNVSGSNVNASIKTASTATTDVNDGSGFKEIRYIIKNTKSTPSSSDFISTSTSFTRSCATSYYAYSAAVDAVGNISEAYYLGSTSDGKNEYSSYGSCSKKCGTGTKSRTNTCALVTTDLSTTCNTQECCSETKTEWGNWSGCSASCGGGTKTRSGKIVSAYDSSVSCGTDTDSTSCNTDACAPAYTPYDCQLRGAIKRYNLPSWDCECGKSHTSAYYHYCADANGNLVTKGQNPSINTYWYVCPNSTTGWQIIEGY